MADEEQLAVLDKGFNAWNTWREQNPNIRPDLSQAELAGGTLVLANLSGANLSGADLSRAWLEGADLSRAWLSGATLIGARLPRANLADALLIDANLRQADLSKTVLVGARLLWANLVETNLQNADLSGADLHGANLSGAILARANLARANLERSILVRTYLKGADLTGCRVYGISAWDPMLEGAKQENLIVTPPDQPKVRVDDLEIAQFIYLLLDNKRIRRVIDNVTSKVVLILGRFTQERKAVLDALREELRQREYAPVVFDFDKPASRSTLETVSTLAHMARFVLADLTDAKSVLQELQAVVPTNPSVPVQPLILDTQEEPGMFDFFRLYSWVLTPCRYASPERLIADLSERVIVPAEAKVSALRGVSPPKGAGS